LPNDREKAAARWGLLGSLPPRAHSTARSRGDNGFAEYRVRDAGVNLAEIKDKLPRRVAEKLAIYLADTGYAQASHRCSGAITLVSSVPPDPGWQCTRYESARHTIDSAPTSSQPNFEYARRLLGLPADTHLATTLADESEIKPTLAIIPDSHFADPDAGKILDAKLVEILNTRPTTSGAAIRCRISSKLIRRPSADTKAEISGSAGKLALELKNDYRWRVFMTEAKFRATETLVITRLTFTMRDGADWKMETLPAALAAPHALANAEDRPPNKR
jgi:hypothetical protein